MPNEENEESTADVSGESKEDKFKRLVEPRVSSTLHKIKIIGNLASNQYAFTADQVEKIMTSLRTAVDEVEQKFQKSLNRKGFNDQGKFKL